ncbi:ATP-binding protein [Methanohalobium sp.]|uniref:ATP-binding protein n=1 Tax=Methanohalobium sp. TaxID=2837493 RepID=UPI0025F640C3|nr:ATP-binding protein [Methanohalobium sp.]
MKFTESGSVTVDIKQTAKEYQFSVIDTGIGIPENKENEIFKSFKQLDSGLNRKYQGIGLGLTLVKRLVNMHEGQ